MDAMTEPTAVRIHVPAELLKLVFEELYLIAPSSLAACRLVSRVWHELSTPILFRKVTLRADTTLGIHEALPDDIYFVLQNDGTLGLPDNSSPQTVGIVQGRKEEACKKSKNRAVSLVEHLIESRGNTTGPEQIASLVRELVVLNGIPPSLRRKGPFTEVDVADETREVLSAIGNGLQSMSALRVLRWDSYDALSGEIIDILACKSLLLKEIHLSRLCLSDTAPQSNEAPVHMLPEFSRFIPVLDKLRSFRCTISGNNRHLLYHVLENCDRLEELGITYSEMSLVDMCTRAGKPWKSRLVTLELSNISFTGSANLESDARFCHSFDFSRLKSIRLEKCTDASIFLRELAAIIGFQAIKQLSLWFPGGETSVADIGPFLKTLGLLGTLELLELVDLGFKVDIDAVVYNKHLKVLRLAEWDVSLPPRYQRDELVGSKGRLWTADEILHLGNGCNMLSEIWVDVAHGAELDVKLMAAFGSMRVLRKLGLCFQPPWKYLDSGAFVDENPPHEEKLLEVGQATVLRIAQLVRANGGRNLREIEIQVLQHGCRERPAERGHNYTWFIGRGGARKVWEIRSESSDVLKVSMVKEDRLMNRYGAPVQYEFDGW